MSKTSSSGVGSTRRDVIARARLFGLAVLCPVLLLTGCTTVTRTSLVSAGPSASADSGSLGTTGEQPGTPGTDSGTTGAGTGGSTGTSSASGTGGSGSSGTGSGGGAGNTSGATTGTTTGTPTGTTCKKPVKVGISHNSDGGAASGAFGATQGISASQLNDWDNAKMQADKTMAQWVNANGGLAGCPAVISFHDYKTLSGDGPAAQTQAECNDFAQDQKVQVAFPQTFETGAIIPCLAKHGIVTFFDSLGYVPSPADYRKYRGLLYASNQITTYRWRPFISLLNQYQFFNIDSSNKRITNPVVGILLADQGDNHNQDLVNKLWVPALKALGIKAVVFTFTYNGDTTTAFNQAVVQFKQNGVTHVLMTPDGGQASVLFLQSANAQQFYPRYGLTSLNSAGAFALISPKEQRRNAVIVSFTPFDVILNGVRSPDNATHEFDTNPRTANTLLCEKIFKGRVPKGSAVQVLYTFCDRWFQLRDAYRGRASTDKASLLAGMDALAGTYAPTMGYGNLFFGPPFRYDAITKVRLAQWHEDKGWFVYLGPSATIPPAAG